MHLLPGINTILTLTGRRYMDLVHIISNGNRRFAMISNPDADLRGFLVEMKRLTPSAVRGEFTLEIVGIERFIADMVFIPEERRGLYINQREALRFANGRIIKDSDLNENSNTLVEINEKLRELERLYI
jgi:hypothetical protein